MSKKPAAVSQQEGVQEVAPEIYNPSSFVESTFSVVLN